MYEVLRFIEHGAHCRQSMDCVDGTILIYYLRDHPEIQKQMLFEWFRQIGTSLDQFPALSEGAELPVPESVQPGRIRGRTPAAFEPGVPGE